VTIRLELPNHSSVQVTNCVCLWTLTAAVLVRRRRKEEEVVERWVEWRASMIVLCVASTSSACHSWTDTTWCTPEWRSSNAGTVADSSRRRARWNATSRSTWHDLFSRFADPATDWLTHEFGRADSFAGPIDDSLTHLLVYISPATLCDRLFHCYQLAELLTSVWRAERQRRTCTCGRTNNWYRQWHTRTNTGY
jgi:hypothetical protein